MNRTETGKDYSFDNFEVNPFNGRAYERAISFANNINSKPLVISGISGTGKTHLLKATNKLIEQRDPSAKVLFVNAEELVEELTESIVNSSSTKAFLDKYSIADVLIIDDIQKVRGKEKTQDEIVRVFDELFEAGKRILISCSLDANDIDLSERMTERLFWGDFVVITEAYSHFVTNRIISDQRRNLIYTWEELLEDLNDSCELYIDDFKSLFKSTWEYFAVSAGRYEVDRNDISIINTMNRVRMQIDITPPKNIKPNELDACLLFLDSFLEMISSYGLQLFGAKDSRYAPLALELPVECGIERNTVMLSDFEAKFDWYCGK